MKSFTDSFLFPDRFRRKSIRSHFFNFVYQSALFAFVFFFLSINANGELRALDPLDPSLSFHSPETPFVSDLVKIRFPEKAEVRRIGNGGHWKSIPTQGRAWMLIVREWEGHPSAEEPLENLLKELFPNSKNVVLPVFKGLKVIGGERKEIISGNPLTVRYFLLQRRGKIVSIYLGFDSENKTIADFFQDPKNFIQSLSSDSF
ncbi:acyltransferase [Leptospira kmetyi]|uniref:Acyltransferase n=1 Tax=Leptospira kmetyi TaxID=408139 RepID=A0ABX4N8L0_9LEPT|nr:acyltransferase [Leptospira kmetyi]PJZ29681.1 acyltransferase [Leptospira kmetyi]